MGSSIPLKLLVEAQGHNVSLELTNGVSYRGKLVEAEDNMNVQLENVVIVAKDGSVKNASHVYIRGSQIQFFSIPEILSNAPTLQRSANK